MTWNWSEVASPTPNPTQKAQGAEWAARLIPGAASAQRNQKTTSSPRAREFLHRIAAIPFAVQEAKRARKAPSRRLSKGIQLAGQDWMQSAVKDNVLVLLNWILVAQVLIRFPG